MARCIGTHVSGVTTLETFVINPLKMTRGNTRAHLFILYYMYVYGFRLKTIKSPSNSTRNAAFLVELDGDLIVFNLFLLREIFRDVFAQTPPLQLPVAEPLDTHTLQDSSACPLNVPQLFGW